MNLPSPQSSSSSSITTDQLAGKQISTQASCKYPHDNNNHHHHHHNHNHHNRKLSPSDKEPPTTAGANDLTSPRQEQWSQDESISNQAEEDASTLSITTSVQRQGPHSQLDATDTDDDEDDEPDSCINTLRTRRDQFQHNRNIALNSSSSSSSAAAKSSSPECFSGAEAFQSLSRVEPVASGSRLDNATGRKKRRLDCFLKGDTAESNVVTDQIENNTSVAHEHSASSTLSTSGIAAFKPEEEDEEKRRRKIDGLEPSSHVSTRDFSSSTSGRQMSSTEMSMGVPDCRIRHHMDRDGSLYGRAPNVNHQSLPSSYCSSESTTTYGSSDGAAIYSQRLPTRLHPPYHQPIEDFHRNPPQTTSMYVPPQSGVFAAMAHSPFSQLKAPPSFAVPGPIYRLPPHNSLGELFPNGGTMQSTSNVRAMTIPGGHASDGNPDGVVPQSQNAQELLTLYQNASEAPSRLPAHKPVRLKQPKHPSAPQGTPVYFKYGEEHYPEETVPDAYTFTESDGTVCRYITNFLVYNKRGERLLPIEVLDQPRHGALVLYGSLLPAAAMGLQNSNNGSDGSLVSCEGSTRSSCGRGRGERRKTGGRRRGEEDCPGHPPYPIRVELAEWCIDYGQEPHNIPFVWLISRWDVYYRLEKPAGRYIPTFSTAKMKFEVSTRIIKTLQWRPDFPYRELVDLLTAATRHERQRKRLEEERRRRRERNRKHQHLKTCANSGVEDGTSDDDLAFGQDECNGEGYSFGTGRQAKKNPRPNWKGNSSLSTPEGTGIVIHTPDGHPGPLTPWKAPFAVENVRESTLLGLTDFLESQMRNFLDGVGGVGGTCANLVETRFMQTLREKASIRRETLQLVETKKRTIESMTAVNGFSHLGGASPFDLGNVGSPPLVALQVLQPIPIRQGLTANMQVAQGCAMASPLVTVGFTGETNNPHHHQAMMILKTKQQEEQELNQLLHLLKEFSDPEDGSLPHCSFDQGDDDSSDDTLGPNDLDDNDYSNNHSQRNNTLRGGEK